MQRSEIEDAHRTDSAIPFHFIAATTTRLHAHPAYNPSFPIRKRTHVPRTPRPDLWLYGL
jgi:hypothetical protein